jgi:undecaprenyl-diphosphatase
MRIVEAIVLGVVQGVTEFLPVSSSGHLAVLEKLMGIREPVALAVVLHFGTFLATLVYFFKPLADIVKGLFKKEKNATRYLLNIVIGSIPAGLFAILFKKTIEDSFSDMYVVAIFLGLTGAVLLLTGIIRKGERSVRLPEALAIGFGQMLALFPGLSRSGLTISAGMFARVRPEEAFQFSFILSLPAVLGANLLELKTISSWGDPAGLLLGMVVSFLSGFLVIHVLKKLVQRHFFYFGFYCLLVSLLCLLFRIGW